MRLKKISIMSFFLPFYDNSGLDEYALQLYKIQTTSKEATLFRLCRAFIFLTFFIPSIILGTMLVESEIREKAYRFVAFSAVSFSLIAIVAVFITLPMVNNYVNSVHQRVQYEMEFCKLSAKEVMLEMHEFRATPKSELPSFLRFNENSQQNGTRIKRQAGQCEGCCLPGAPGPAGRPGKNGVPGRPGAPGAPGFPGRPPA